jgi:hypothetical protein
MCDAVQSSSNTDVAALVMVEDGDWGSTFLRNVGSVVRNHTKSQRWNNALLRVFSWRHCNHTVPNPRDGVHSTSKCRLRLTCSRMHMRYIMKVWCRTLLPYARCFQLKEYFLIQDFVDATSRRESRQPDTRKQLSYIFFASLENVLQGLNLIFHRHKFIFIWLRIWTEFECQA